MKIFKAVETLQNAINPPKENQFFLGNLLKRASIALEEYPTDKTILGMAKIFDQKAKNGELFISKSEMLNVFNTFYSSESQAKNIFSNELGEFRNIEQKIKKSSNDENFDNLVKQSYDQKLAHSLQKLINPSEQSFLDKKIIAQCENICKNEIQRCGLKSDIKVLYSNDKMAICQASFRTPKGATSFIVPIDIKNNNVLIPSYFISNGGFSEISEKNIKYALNKYAGENLNFHPKQLIEVFASSRKEDISSLGEVEAIVLKNKLDKAKSAALENAILGISMPSLNSESTIAPPKMSKVAEKISDNLTSPAGTAEFLFGKNAVQQGYHLICQILNEFGHKNIKTKIASVDNKSITYQIALPGMKVFQVPVRIQMKQAMIPKFIISENGLSEFTKEAVSGLAPTLKIAEFSPLNEQNDEQLVETIRQACAEKQMHYAEEALTILNSRNSPLIRMAFTVYTNSLSGKEEHKSRCSKPIKVSNSIHILCGHTRLPLDKVYQDEFGDCCPIWRKNIAKPETLPMAMHKVIL